MGETEEFNTLAFEKKLMQLKDTQESIQGLSSWCLKQRSHHKKIVSSWLNVLKRVKVEQRLVLFYLANDVIQYSKRKNYEFVESWGLNLQKATPLVRDEKVRSKILRIFKIWEQRSVYDDEFLSDLTGLLSAGAIKKTDDDDFQPQQLVNKIKQCTVLEADTDMRLKCIHDSHLQLSDADALCANLKDRSLKDDVEKELNEGIACVERYTQALQREIVAREALLALLTSANHYYSTQRGQVKIVAHAYKTFGARVRALKRKLDELIPTLPNSAPSPPERDEDVPSPGPDEDLDLPVTGDNTDDDLAYNIDQSFNTTLGADGSLYNLGLSSFLTSDNPLAMFNDTNDLDLSSANKIEVINSRPNNDKPDFNINDFLKTFAPNDSNIASDNNSVASGTLSQKSQDALPGLDLLTPESTGHPPPISFYGTMDTVVNDEPDQPYIPEIISNEQWKRNNWNLPPHTSPVRGPPLDTPESPPPAPAAPPVPPRALPSDVYVQDLPAADVDQRGILPPPPPPPMLPLLGNIEDVDHRLLPALPPPPPPMPVPNIRHPTQHQDVDHRNLIPLTHQLPPPTRPGDPVQLDKDYRVPSMVPPPDIVESVDMELSDDEEQQRMYVNPSSNRRSSFNNNKVLVGGTKSHEPNSNLIQINNTAAEPPHSAPVIPMSNPFELQMSNQFDKPPMSNQFDKHPMSNQFDKPPMSNQFDKHPMSNQFDKPPMSNQFDKHPMSNQFDKHPMSNQFDKHPMSNQFDKHPMSNQFDKPPMSNQFDKPPMSNSIDKVQPMSHPFDKMPPNMQFMSQDEAHNISDDESAFEEDLRSRSLDNMDRNSPNDDWNRRQNRFPRNWTPRMRPMGPQFWPRPRPNRWMGPPRPQRFW